MDSNTEMKNLSTSEYDMIISVLKRDRELRSLEEMRLRQMKQELSYLRKKGALKPGFDASRSCARCVNELGRIINRGAPCRLCLKKVCKACRQYGEDDGGWICVFCYKQKHLKAISGEWMQDLCSYSARKQLGMPPGDELRKVLHEFQRKGLMFESDQLENVHPIGTLVSKALDESFEVSSNQTSKTHVLDDFPAIAAHSEDSTKSSAAEQEHLNIHKGKSFERVSPWNGIEAEPTIPVRLFKSVPIGISAHPECVDAPYPRDRQSSDDGHSTMSIRSQSTSSDVLDENDTSVVFSNKHSSSIKKQQAVSDGIILQNSSVDTTDSGVCSPVLKCDGVESSDVHPMTKIDATKHVKDKFENHQHTMILKKLSCESSFSESDDDFKKSGIVFRKVTLKKRKSVPENILMNEETENSAETTIDTPPLGPTNKRVSNKKFNFAKHPKLSSKPISWSFTKNKSGLINFDGGGGGNKFVNRLTHTDARLHADTYSLPPACFSFINPWAHEDDSEEQFGDTDDDQNVTENLTPSPSVRKRRGAITRKSRPRRRSHQACCKCKHPSRTSSTDCRSSRNWLNNRTLSSRSYSLPTRRTRSEDWLEQCLWESNSMDSWMWFLADQPERPMLDRSERRYDRMLPDDYKLVYISSTASSVSETSSGEESDFSVQPKRVNCPAQMSGGMLCVQDSGYEWNPGFGSKLLEDDGCHRASFVTGLNIDAPTHSSAHCKDTGAVCTLFHIFRKSRDDKYCCRVKSRARLGYDCGDSVGNLHAHMGSMFFLETFLHAVSSHELMNHVSFLSQGLSDRADGSVSVCSPDCATSWTGEMVRSDFPQESEEALFPFKPNAHICLLSNNNIFYCVLKQGSSSPLILAADLSLLSVQSSEEFRAICDGELQVSIPRRICALVESVFSGRLPLSEQLSFPKYYKIRRCALLPSSDQNARLNENCFDELLVVGPMHSNCKALPVAAMPFARGNNELSVSCLPTDSTRSLGKPDFFYGYSVENIFSFFLNARKPVCSYILLQHDFLLRNRSAIYTLQLDNREVIRTKMSQPDWREFCGHLLQSPRRQEVWSKSFVSRNTCLATSPAPSCRANVYSQSANRANDSSSATGLERCASATGVVDPDLRPLERGWSREVPAPDGLTPFVGRDVPELLNFGALWLAARADALYCRHGPPVTSDTEPEVGNMHGGKMSVEPCPLSLVVSGAVGGVRTSAAVCSRDTSTDLSNVTDAEKCFARPIALVRSGAGRYLSLDIYFLNSRFHRDICGEPFLLLPPLRSTLCVASAKPDSQVCSRLLLEGGGSDPKPPTPKKGTKRAKSARAVEDVSKLVDKYQRAGSICLNYNNDGGHIFNSLSIVLTSKMQETPTAAAEPMKDLFNAFDNSLLNNFSVVDREFCETEQYLLHETNPSCVKAIPYDNILPCIKRLFTGSYASNDETSGHRTVGMNLPHSPQQVDSSSRSPEMTDRVDCSCHRPCEVPLSPTITSAVVDSIMEVTATEDTEGLSSGDELDKLESDTDSQDTVIEGEAYKRIRSVAIKEKILHANEELFRKCDFSPNSGSGSVPHNFDDGLKLELKSKDTLLQNERAFSTSADSVQLHANENVFLSSDSINRNTNNESKFLEGISCTEPEELCVDLCRNEKSFNSCTESNPYNGSGHSLTSVTKINENISLSKNKYESDDKTPRVGNSLEFHTSSPCMSFREVLYSSESSDNGSDGEEVILSDTSTSSDEASYIAPTVGHIYCGQPISYGLDTILEESCEESERSSRDGTPTCRDSADYDHCYNSGRLSRSSSKSSKHNAEKIDARCSLSEPLLGMKNTTYYDSKCGKGNASNSKLATSRLEKYFKSGLIESKRFSFPDDDLTDESGGVSSDEDDEPQEMCPMLPSKSSDKQTKHRPVGLTQEKATSPTNNCYERRLNKPERKKCEFITEYGVEKANSSEPRQRYEMEFFAVFSGEDNFSGTHNAYDAIQKDYSCSTMSHLSALLLEKFAVGSVKDDDKIDPNSDLHSAECENREGVFRKTEKLAKSDGLVLSDSDNVSDEETKHIMSHVLNHIKVDDKGKDGKDLDTNDISPALKILESEIARLMLTVSPVSLSVGEPSSSCSSTIGSNNSDYGSDTLESGEDSATDEDMNEENSPGEQSLLTMASEIEATAPSISTPPTHVSVGQIKSTNSGVSDETLYICKQLMASLKKIADSADAAMVCHELCKAESDDHSAKQYIAEQIVSLMQTVNASRNGSPMVERSLLGQSCSVGVLSNDPQDVSDVESPHHNDEKCESSKSKTPSESGSETTISASISIPSYEDSDCTPTESEISHEMDELYALLETNGTATDLVATKRCADSDALGLNEGVFNHAFDSATSDEDESVKQLFPNSRGKDPSVTHMETSLLHGAASHLESLLPITIEERIARYKAAFFSKENDQKSSELGDSSMMRINVILPQPVTPAPTTVSVQRIDNTAMSRTKCFDSDTRLKADFNFNRATDSDNFARTSSTCDASLSERIKCSVTSVKIVPKDNFESYGVIDAFNEGSCHSSCFKEDSEFLRFENCGKMNAALRTSESNLFNTKETQCDLMGSARIEQGEGEDSSLISPLPKAINPKEKASSENDLLVADYRAKSKGNKVSGTKSASNISELESIGNKSSFRDTGYYSFKSSEESILSLDDSATSRTSTASLTQYRSLTSTETIPEEEESCSKAANSPKISLSSGNIPDAVLGTPASKSSTLPLSLRGKLTSAPGGNHRARSSFFSTSGVLRKLTLLRDESGNSLRSSPHGRLRVRNRTLSGESEDGKQKKGPIPQISVSECLESSIGQANAGSSEKDSVGTQEDDLDQVFTYHSRSQMSLSSFGARSESMTSVYSAAGGGRYGTVAVTGEVLFGLNYNYKASTLDVHIKECRNLAPVDTKRNRSDPYAKVYLLPDRTKSGKRKTKVKKHTLSPIFDEMLRFQVTISELEARTLWLSVWHSDMFGRNDFLGEVMLPLGYDTLEIPGPKWYPLQERLEAIDTPVSYKGDLILALKYVPPDVTTRKHHKKPGDQNKGALHVLVKEARNLMATRSNGTSDPFCKSYLLPDKSKSGKQKTSVLKKTCSPKWNHTFVYEDVSLSDLRERCLELTIWDYDKITSNDFLGGVRLSLGSGKYQGRDVDWMDSVGEEVSLWYTMLDRPNMWVDGSLLLRPSMQNRRA